MIKHRLSRYYFKPKRIGLQILVYKKKYIQGTDVNMHETGLYAIISKTLYIENPHLQHVLQLETGALHKS